MLPRRGAIAFCSRKRLGLITSDTAHTIEYEDGTSGVAWTGIQLTEGDVTWVGDDGGNVVHQMPGDPWSSRNPIVIGYVDDILDSHEGLKVWDFVPEFALALARNLRENDDPRWKDTWLKRTRKGQEERTINNFKDKFDKYLNAGQPIQWLRIAGDALICWVREQHPEIWPE